MAGRSSLCWFCQSRNSLQRDLSRKSIATIITRSFTSSRPRRRHGALPIFTETPSEDLNNLLSTLRSKIFIPSHLNPQQRSVIYRTKNHAGLLNDPFYVDIGDETVQLEPIDRTKDVPDSWKSVMRALDLVAKSAAENKDNRVWNNLVALLDGMRKAGRKWKTWQWEWLVRRVGEAGAAHIILAAVQQAEQTGLYLRDIRVVREVFWALRMRAVQGEWSAEATDKALRYARQVAVAMEDEAHCGGKRSPGSPDPRHEADVIGVIVELLAVRLDQHLGRGTAEYQEDEKELESFVLRLVDNLDTSAIVLGYPPEQLWAADVDYELMRWIPASHGLSLVQRMTRDGLLHGKVEPIVKHLSEELEKHKDVVKANENVSLHKRRGFNWLNKLKEV